VHRGDRAAAFRRLGRQTSVWHYLVALALLPCIGAVSLSALVVRAGVDDAAQAAQIDQAMVSIQRLHDLHVAVVDIEATSTATGDTLLALGLSSAEVNRFAGVIATTPVPQARAGTRCGDRRATGRSRPGPPGRAGGGRDRHGA
jgi:hypothetical protein